MWWRGWAGWDGRETKQSGAFLLVSKTHIASQGQQGCLNMALLLLLPLGDTAHWAAQALLCEALLF
jgi:hypothetical protein